MVDPGVCGTYEWRLEKVTGGGTLTVPEGAATELGADRKPYRVVELAAETGSVPAGRYLVDEAGTVAWSARKVGKFDAPKAQLFRLIIDGTIGGRLPWGLVLIGFFLAIMMEMVGVSSLPFAVGLYLPISTSAGIFVGGVVRWLVDRRRSGESTTEAEFSPGMLMASGLIAGGAIAGVAQAVIAGGGWDAKFDLHELLPESLASNDSWWPLLPFVLMAIGLYVVGTKRSQGTSAKQ